MLSTLTDDTREELSKYVKKAKGGLTLDEFSAKSGISKYHLSRLINGRIKNVPRESTIIAIANASENKAIRRFLKWCFLSDETLDREERIDPWLTSNHSDTESISDDLVPYEKKKRRKSYYNKKAIQSPAGIVLNSLLSLPFEWTRILTPSPVTIFIANYFCVEFSEDAPFKKWHFLFLQDHPYDYESYLWSTIGILMEQKPSIQEKYTIVLDSQRRYRQAKLCKRYTSNINLSVILINSNTRILEMYIHLEKDVTFEDLKSIRLT